MTMFTISVPASSANIGPGFDSVGLAVKRYLTLEVSVDQEWKINHNHSYLPPNGHYKDHFIYQVAKNVAQTYHKKLSPCKVNVTSEIPLARGLGSSASAVIAGIELANQLCQLSLTTYEKLNIATDIEGHPDNVAPALLGGFVITATLDDELIYTKIEELNVDIILYIPNIELTTNDARSVLPAKLTREKAACASGISNLFIAALLQENYSLAGKMMENDLFHEPYRAKLIPDYVNIRENAKKHGAYGTVISGAGPSMLSFVPREKSSSLAEAIHQAHPNYDVLKIQMDERGVQVT